MPAQPLSSWLRPSYTRTSIVGGSLLAQGAAAFGGDPGRGGEPGSPHGPGPGADARTIFQRSIDVCKAKLPIGYAEMRRISGFWPYAAGSWAPPSRPYGGQFPRSR